MEIKKNLWIISSVTPNPAFFGETNLLTPFSIVSKTNVDASWTNVFVLTLEKPEIADDSESEDRLDWSKVGTTNLGPIFYFTHFTS